MKQIELWKFTEDKLKAGYEVMLMVVAESSKSSPGRAGFKMAVSSDRSFAGTVGGGIMEFRLVEECFSLMSRKEKVRHVRKLVHNKNAGAEKSGLICGGSETIILFSLNSADLATISGIIANYKDFRKSSLRISPEGIFCSDAASGNPARRFRFDSEGDWLYEETAGFPDIVYVIGGGHVGLAVSKVLSTQDFYIVNIDPRKDVFTVTSNIYADKKLHIPYSETGEYLIEGENSFAVVVTSEHDTDLAVLRSIVKKKFRYIGLMGSKIKIRSIFSNLLQEGIPQELLNNIHAPIGIEIEAETPEQIGISIAAEIINVKNTHTQGN